MTADTTPLKAIMNDKDAINKALKGSYDMMNPDTTPQEEIDDILNALNYAVDYLKSDYATSKKEEDEYQSDHDIDIAEAKVALTRLIERKVLEGYQKGWKDAMEQENVPMKGDGNE